MRKLYDAIHTVSFNERIQVTNELRASVETLNIDNETVVPIYASKLRVRLEMGIDQYIADNGWDQSKVVCATMERAKKQLCYDLCQDLVRKLRDLEMHVKARDYDPVTNELIEALWREIEP